MFQLSLSCNRGTSSLHILPFTMKIVYLQAIISSVLVHSLQVSLAIDTISLSHPMTDGMTIVSNGETFELGFFNPGDSKKRYVGIWYKSIPIQTVVWVANRASPISDSSGVLAIHNTGNLVLAHNNTIVWYTTSEKQAKNPVAQLLDSGNLVIRDENEENPEAYLWQSFDYPSDTFLPGMKLGWDLRVGLNRNLTSWKSPDDPAPGDFSLGIKLYNYPELYMIKGAEKYFRAGPWNGMRFNGLPQLMPNPLYTFKFISNKDEVYYEYQLRNKSVLARSVLNQTTYLHERFVWVQADRKWKAYITLPLDDCDHYGLCGVYGNCLITNFPYCQCLKGFNPKSPQAWMSFDWSQGCVRNKPLSCMNNGKDGFIKLEGLKLPDTRNALVDKTIGLEECKIKCLNNCSCMAYTNSDIKGASSGCVMWFDDLIDVREFPSGGQDLYIRMAASDIDAENGNKKSTIIVATIISAIFGMPLFGFCCIYKVSRNMTEKSKNIAVDQNNDEEDLDLPLFDLSTIATVTDNFSNMSKIGEGGFGPVYKGKLENGQEIAVKRLSKSSRQGMIEFKNEVKLIAKLQHRNLVKLLGCCMQWQEMMLIYEYMPNSSLDHFIFDYTKGKLLDWHERFSIICGIARGLLYLHQDSRLRVIHRDLKASNVLLDDKLNPKISDFGLAKIFGGEQIEGNTSRIVGTYGYMAPEYVTNGRFSLKSDVFSFSILVLEIICGKRNRGFYHPDDGLNLFSYAWKMWKEDKALELVDTNMKNSCIVSEVMRCIHVSFLCVQQFPEDRPTMSYVVQLLGGENELVEPKLPPSISSQERTQLKKILPLFKQEQAQSTKYPLNENSSTEIKPKRKLEKMNYRCNVFWSKT